MFHTLVLLFMVSQPSVAQDLLDPIIVTADKNPTPLSKVTASAVLIEADEIEQKYQGSVDKALRSVSGIELFNQGGLGRNNSLFLRGANSEHVLVLIDGVKVNDSISPTRAFDFARLNSTAIERIEIIKGSQSVLYGSDALAGVINIITKRGTEIFKSDLNVEYGSFESKKMGFSVSGQKNKTAYSGFLNLIHNEGFSSAPSLTGGENDGHRQADLALNLDYEVHSKLKVGFGIKQVLARTELDDRGGFGGDDPDLVEKTSQTTVHSYINQELSENSELSFKLDYNSFERQNRDLPTIADPVDKKDFFKGEKVQADLQYGLKFLEDHSLILGLNFESEIGETNTFSKANAETTGIFTQLKSEWGSFLNNVGLRYDKHTRGDVETLNFSFSPGYIITKSQTKLRASVGSGFKAPSLFNLFDPLFGNPDLKPERSLNYEIGFDQEFFGGYTRMSGTYFKTYYEDLFFFDPANGFKAINLERALVEGVELSLKSAITKNFDMGLSYNYLFKVLNETAGEDLVRRPKQSWSMDLGYKYSNNLQINLNFRQQGSRTDFDAVSFERKKLSSFDRLDLSFHYQWSRKLKAYLNLDNIFNDKTQQIDGYNEAGFMAFTGLSYKL